jgi:hypothetical protein
MQSGVTMGPELFWEQGTAHGRNAKVEYYCRQDRLEEIRSELAELSDIGEWC